MGRRIAIVGNGEILEGAADIIDCSDLVIRFNDCRSIGSGGEKTDIVAVCNTGRPGKVMTEDAAWRATPGVSQASAIWSVRHPVKFAEMQPSLVQDWPELDDFCADYSDGFAAIAASSGKDHLVIPREVHDELDRVLKIVTVDPYVCPSSGLLAIAYVLSLKGAEDDTVVIAGFSHEGWHGHPFHAEKQLVSAFEAAGRLTNLSHMSLPSASQGA